MNIVFDFAGVLFQWQPHEFMARLLPERAATPDAARVLVADFFEGFGGDWADFDRGTIATDRLAQRIAQRTGLSVGDARKVIDAVPHELLPIEPMVEMLRRLHARGHALFFLSNMPAAYADHLDASHEFLGLFRAGVFSSRVQLIKPEPEMFAHALQAFGIEARDTLFIDDLLPNAEAARRAGWQAVHFQSPAQCQDELVRLGLL